MKIIYRISDNGYKKEKPVYIDNEKCLKNFYNVFFDYIYDITILADNCSTETLNMIKKYIDPLNIEKVSVGHGAGTFNLALDKALKFPDDEIIYFVENDYLHHQGSPTVIEEGIKELNASFVTLYDHPDKYLDPDNGGNPYCQGGAETTRVYLTKSTHWKLTNSTTMTFAATVKTLKTVEPILRKYTTGSYPEDFQMFLELRNKDYGLISPIPGYSTHGESKWLSPLTDWENL